MSEQGERLLAVLRQKPELLFEVCQALQDTKVVGPWTEDLLGKITRRLPNGKKVAVIHRHATRNLNPWVASVSKTVLTEQPDEVETQKNHAQQGWAKEWCDGILKTAGYILT